MEHRPYRNFLITGTQRTGSSAVAEAVGTHPAIACGWEWTEHCPRGQRLRIAEAGFAGHFDALADKDRRHMQSILTAEVGWIGFRRLFGASDKWLLHPRFSVKLWLDRFDRHLNWIRSQPDLHIIHVVRDDHLEWLKSKYVARSTNQYVGSAYPDVQVTIPLRQAKARVRAKLWVDRQLATLAATNPYLQVEYQQLSNDLPGTAQRAVRFLDCDPARLRLDHTVIRKQSSDDGRSYVRNYDALARVLTGAPFVPRERGC